MKGSNKGKGILDGCEEEITSENNSRPIARSQSQPRQACLFLIRANPR